MWSWVFGQKDQIGLSSVSLERIKCCTCWVLGTFVMCTHYGDNKDRQNLKVVSWRLSWYVLMVIFQLSLPTQGWPIYFLMQEGEGKPLSLLKISFSLAIDACQPWHNRGSKIQECILRGSVSCIIHNAWHSRSKERFDPLRPFYKGNWDNFTPISIPLEEVLYVPLSRNLHWLAHQCSCTKPSRHFLTHVCYLSKLNSIYDAWRPTGPSAGDN